jgi:hypothetical protein
MAERNLKSEAEYIFEWLERRNRGQLREAIESMRVLDRRLAIDELALILLHGGRPPNWEKFSDAK